MQAPPIPVSVAKAIADDFTRDVVVVCAWSQHAGTIHTTTYGRPRPDGGGDWKAAAAEAGELCAAALGGDLSRATRFEDFRGAAQAANNQAKLELIRTRIAAGDDAGLAAWLRSLLGPNGDTSA